MRMPTELLPSPRRWSLNDPPPFLEAYPTISVGAAYREGKQGRDHVVWRDDKRVITGAAQAIWNSPECLMLRYRIEERPYYDARSGEVGLSVVWKGSQENNRRPFVVCPRCGAHVDVLVHMGEWLCGKTTRHGLKHRSACLSKEVRWSEKLAELEGQIAVAEALGTIGRTHQKHLAERDGLLARLNYRPVTANTLQLARVTTEWVQAVMLAP